MADIVLLNPRFEASYWGLEYALPLFRKRANLPVAALPLLAALTPPEHGIELIDECVEDLDFDRIAKADIVGVTGMIVQRRQSRSLIYSIDFAAMNGLMGFLTENCCGGNAALCTPVCKPGASAKQPVKSRRVA